MRCPTCNTENTPDSRFCGGCGAKLALTEPRVAPTAKIPDDAPFPIPGALTTTTPGVHPPQPISYAPPSMPPRVIPPITRVPEASLSMPVPRRRTGLLATVLVIDLALAASGAVLLAKGLEPPNKASVVAPATQTQATPPAPAVAPAPPASGSGLAAIGSGSADDDAFGSALARLAAGSGVVGGVGAIDVPPPAPAPIHAAAKHGPSPQDPYDTAHALANEVELAADRAGPDFERCLQTSLRETAIHGAIHVSFAVAPDGHVDHARAADNTTGSASLAGCLIGTISAWRFATHPTHLTSFVRPFSYP
jgi:hypothetical protein